jgi:hypothetical protein
MLMGADPGRTGNFAAANLGSAGDVDAVVVSLDEDFTRRP